MVDPALVDVPALDARLQRGTGRNLVVRGQPARGLMIKLEKWPVSVA